MNNGREATGKRPSNDATVVACVVFETHDPDQLVQLLKEALTGSPMPLPLRRHLRQQLSGRGFWRIPG